MKTARTQNGITCTTASSADLSATLEVLRFPCRHLEGLIGQARSGPDANDIRMLVIILQNLKHLQ